MSNADRMAAECYRKGTDAMNKQNWDLAVAMFTNCVKIKPEPLNYRQLLRNSTKKKFDDNGTGAGTFAKAKLIGIRSRIKKARTKEDWDEVCVIAEEGLLINPWDAGLNAELARACIKLERTEVARFSFLEAIKSATKDKALHVEFADLLEERREYDEAMKICQRIQVIDPKDMHIRSRIQNLAAMKTTDRGNYETAENTRDVTTSANALNPNKKEDIGTQEEVLRHAIRREPDALEHYTKLAHFLKSSKKLEEAYEIMQKALEVSNDDTTIREQTEDYELLVMLKKITIAKEKANESEDADDRKEVASMSKELRQRKIDIFTARVERHPTNMKIKLELAQLLMQLQQWKSAIKLLQQASQDPRLKTRALVNLGKCFVYDKKPALAKGQFEQAVPNLDYDTDPAVYLDCQYLLGRVCEETGDTEGAIKAYGDVLGREYDYKDATERFEALQS